MHLKIKDNANEFTLVIPRGNTAGQAVCSLDKPVVFVHVPKTAGSTFSNILRSFALDNPEYCYCRLGFRGVIGPSLLKFDGPGKAMFTGHVSLHQDYQPSDYSTTVILRDPAELQLSWYRHSVKHLTGRMPCVDDYAEMYEVLEKNKVVSNPVTKQLAGYTFDKLGLTESDIKVGDAALKLAMANLNKMEVVGLQEAFPEFLELFLFKYGLPPLVYRSINVSESSSSNQDLPRDLYEKMLHYNALDHLLYEAAATRFVAEYKAYSEQNQYTFSVDQLDQAKMSQTGNQLTLTLPDGSEIEAMVCQSDGIQQYVGCELAIFDLDLAEVNMEKWMLPGHDEVRKQMIMPARFDITRI